MSLLTRMAGIIVSMAGLPVTLYSNIMTRSDHDYGL